MASITHGLITSNKNQVIFSATFVFPDGKPEIRYEAFLISKELKEAFFILDEKDNLVASKKGIYNVSNFYQNYADLRQKIAGAEDNSQNDLLKNQLDTAFQYYNTQYSKDTSWYALHMQTLNQYYYKDLSQVINKNTAIAKSLIADLNDPIVSTGLHGLLYNHARFRNDFSTLDTSSVNPSQYLQYLAQGTFLYLKNEFSEANENYGSAKKWFFSSAWYKANKEAIDKTFATVSNIEFKNYVKKLSFTNTKGQVLTMRQIINQHPSPYYLLDFWATWCKPCIEGAKIIKEKGVPAKVKVLSLSLDRPNRKEKWKEMTLELQQDYTYWVKIDANLKAFVDALKLKAIPRYILVDGEFNIIDNAFYAPYEPKFLPTLEKL